MHRTCLASFVWPLWRTSCWSLQTVSGWWTRKCLLELQIVLTVAICPWCIDNPDASTITRSFGFCETLCPWLNTSCHVMPQESRDHEVTHYRHVGAAAHKRNAGSLTALTTLTSRVSEAWVGIALQSALCFFMWKHATCLSLYEYLWAMSMVREHETLLYACMNILCRMNRFLMHFNCNVCTSTFKFKQKHVNMLHLRRLIALPSGCISLMAFSFNSQFAGCHGCHDCHTAIPIHTLSLFQGRSCWGSKLSCFARLGPQCNTQALQTSQTNWEAVWRHMAPLVGQLG